MDKAQLIDTLTRLCAGQLSADDWLEWWAQNSNWIAGHLNQGQWLRLKPRQPGRFGPPSRCALISQQEAFRLLDLWRIEHEQSARYEHEWQAAFERLSLERERTEADSRNRFRARLDCLKRGFPGLAMFLSSNLNEIERLDEPALIGEIQQLEQALGEKLPESYCRLLACTKAIAYRDTVQIGMPFTFRHPDDPGLPSAGRICFGEYWLEGDGDQVLFGDVGPGNEPPVLYYNHSRRSVVTLADNFLAWVESPDRA